MKNSKKVSRLERLIIATLIVSNLFNIPSVWADGATIKISKDGGSTATSAITDITLGTGTDCIGVKGGTMGSQVDKIQTGTGADASAISGTVYGIKVTDTNSVTATSISSGIDVKSSSNHAFAIYLEGTGANYIKGLASINAETSKSNKKAVGIESKAGDNAKFSIEFADNGTIAVYSLDKTNYGVIFQKSSIGKSEVKNVKTITAGVSTSGGTTSGTAYGIYARDGVNTVAFTVEGSSITAKTTGGTAYGICVESGTTTVSGLGGITVAGNADSVKIALVGGTLNLNSSTVHATDGVNTLSVTNDATLNLVKSTISGGVKGESGKTLTMTMDKDSIWNVNADVTGGTIAVTNHGTINFDGDTSFKGTISGTGTTEIKGKVNLNGKSITQKIIKMDTEGASLTYVSTLSGNENESKIQISNGTVVRDTNSMKIYGGLSTLVNGETKGNEVAISGGTITGCNEIDKGVCINGGKAYQNGGIAKSNKVTISGGTLTNILEVYGGYGTGVAGGDTATDGNTVIISGGTITGTTEGVALVGGWSSSSKEDSSAKYNVVEIKDGILNKVDRIWGGRGYMASNNQVKISGGTIGGIDDGIRIVGGFGANKANGTADNTVTISGGTLSKVGGIVGGVTYDGVASWNKVTVNDTANVTAIGYDFFAYTVAEYSEPVILGEKVSAAGGASLHGNAENNEVTLAAGTYEKMVAGGYTGATASNNTVTISGGTYTDSVYGGYGVTFAIGNTVNISGGTFMKDIYAANKVSSDDTKKNTITITGTSAKYLGTSGVIKADGAVVLGDGNAATFTVGNGTDASALTFASGLDGKANSTLTIKNNSSVTLQGTSNVSGTINGAGTLTNGGTLNIDADNLGVDIANNQTLTLTDGTLAKNIIGTGTTVIDGTVSGTGNIANGVTVKADKSFTNTGTVSGAVTNNGIFTTTANGITGSVTNTNTGTIHLTGGSGNAVIINNGGTVEVKAKDVSVTSITGSTGVETYAFNLNGLQAGDTMLNITDSLDLDTDDVLSVTTGNFAENATLTLLTETTGTFDLSNLTFMVDDEEISSEEAAQVFTLDVGNTSIKFKNVNLDVTVKPSASISPSDNKVVVNSNTEAYVNEVKQAEPADGKNWKHVYGGYSKTDDVKDNTLVINDGLIKGNVYAGKSENTEATVSGNKLEWNGGTIKGSEIMGNEITVNGTGAKYLGTEGRITADDAVALTGKLTVGDADAVSKLTFASGLNATAGSELKIANANGEVTLAANSTVANVTGDGTLKLGGDVNVTLSTTGGTITTAITSDGNGSLVVKSGTLVYEAPAGKTIDVPVIIMKGATMDPDAGVFKKSVLNYGTLVLEGGTLTQSVTNTGGTLKVTGSPVSIGTNGKITLDAASVLAVKAADFTADAAVKGITDTNFTFADGAKIKLTGDTDDEIYYQLFDGDEDLIGTLKDVITLQNVTGDDGEFTEIYPKLNDAGTAVLVKVVSLNPDEMNLNCLAGIQQGTISMNNQINDAFAENIGLVGRGRTDGQYAKEVWASYLNNRDDVDGFNSANYRTKYHGVAVGADLLTTDKVIAGVALTYADGESNGYGVKSAVRNDSKFYGIKLYDRVTNKHSVWVYDLDFVKSQNETAVITFTGKETTADADVNSYSAGVRWERDIPLKGSKLVPFASAHYLRLTNKNFANSRGLAYSTSNLNFLQPKAGVTWIGEYKMTRSGWTAKPKAEIGYLWAVGNRETETALTYKGKAKDSVFFDVTDRSAYYAKAGVEFQKKNLTAGVGYSYMKGSSVRSNRWNVNLGFSF